MSILHIDKAAFEKITAQTGKDVLIDFWAEWCGPCQMLGQEMEMLSAEHPELVIGKVNVDQNRELAVSMGIDSIPALFLYRDGKLVKRMVGYMDKETLAEQIGLK